MMKKLTRRRTLMNYSWLNFFPNKIYLLEILFGYKMDPSKDLDTNLDEYNRLVQNLASNDKKFDD